MHLLYLAENMMRWIFKILVKIFMSSTDKQPHTDYFLKEYLAYCI